MEDTATAPDALDQLLRGEYPDPDGGPPIGVPVKVVHIARSLSGMEADVVAPLGLGRRLAVVSDPLTREVLGTRIERALAGLGTIVPVELESQPHADAQTVETVRGGSRWADALVAVGSGTINDLCKFAAAKDRKPYVVFATAPSMNGYTSMNAAITVDGHKQSLPAAPPLGVFMDLEVLAAAPARMIRAGLGDSLCRPTAQADWLLSHHLLGTPYRRAPFAMLAEDESILLDRPEALLRGDLGAMRALARTLVLSGLGMTICNGSYPASQGEHLISHYIDMFAPARRENYFHGEQVAVATLTMARLQEEMLAAGPPPLRPSPITSTELKDRFGSEIGEACWREFESKRVTDETAPTLTQRAAHAWSALSDGVRGVAVPAARLATVMKRAGGPTTPADIGLSPAFYTAAVRNARFLRNRYTFLDVADDSGRLARLWPAWSDPRPCRDNGSV
jgi:glycerol-1-phosphate dehydrogenase [NAD(P)+]